MQRFVLIDGNAILHRAFHALPPLTSKNGELVNAVYGFFSMFLKILQDVKPTYLAVCFDRAAPTFRQQLYVGYQAQRPKTADELVPQIDLIHKILEKMKVSIFEIDGYEADDLIGTIAYQIQNSKFKIQNLEVIIVSGDRDMLQLVNSHVKALMPITGITKMQLFNSEAVEEKYGIKPTQIVDYKALVGDASDNYPGVSGIGPKTASNLLKEFKTLEKIFQSLSEIKKKNEGLAKKLAEGAEAAGLAKKLAEIVTDAPITLDIERCSIVHFDMEGARESFEELGFKSLVKRLLASGLREDQEGNNQLGLLDKIASS
ncbi:MAG: hypothetical protein HYY87_03825 [Candidatus Levybacteria bacterium]|nr:hypothetical protein [Candidatus Levybacteria bacterium]MBI3070401.1 hypothetical protein [Candidatus Levybacteria bacterium]